MENTSGGNKRRAHLLFIITIARGLGEAWKEENNNLACYSYVLILHRVRESSLLGKLLCSTLYSLDETNYVSTYFYIITYIHTYLFKSSNYVIIRIIKVSE